MKIREALWSAVACYRFDLANLLTALASQATAHRSAASKLA